MPIILRQFLQVQPFDFSFIKHDWQLKVKSLQLIHSRNNLTPNISQDG